MPAYRTDSKLTATLAGVLQFMMGIQKTTGLRDQLIEGSISVVHMTSDICYVLALWPA